MPSSGGVASSVEASIEASVEASVEPDAGAVLVDDQVVHELDRRALAELRGRIGYVFQFAALFDSMTVAENIRLGLVKRGHDEDEIRARIEESLAVVELPGVEDKYPAELSGGMRKRVGIARAIALKPRYILYDEPTTGLDPVTSAVMDQLMIRTRDRYEVTSVIVTHDMTTARKVADRVVMLYPLGRLEPNESQILYDGPPDGLDKSKDRRVTQFVRGEAGDRMTELSEQGEG